MNKTLNDLKERRSVRGYQDKCVPEDKLDQILEAGLYAASPRQDTVLVAVQKPETVKELKALNAKVVEQQSGEPADDPYYGAPTIIVVLAKQGSSCAVENGSLVLGNLMNAAHAVGVESCWIHRAKEVFELPEGKALLKQWGLKDDYVGIGNLALGYPSGDYPEAQPRDPKRIVKIL
ncbi:MAG: nitroreductase family protein [Saccharofermentanales bacterium]